MSLFLGGTKIDGVHLGSTPATAMYLGTEKVWPIYVGNLSPWIKYNGSTVQGVEWPAGAQFVDVIVVGGGAGGTGTGAFGGKQLGGGSGAWQGWTIPRTGELQSNATGGTQGQPITYNGLNINWGISGGKDGVGGGNFNTEAADGSNMFVQPRNYTVADNSTKFGPSRTGTNAADKTSNTGNRNGGNVAASFTFNGRTYTLASYGAGAGVGGNSSNKNGSNGTAPGGGGQSANDGGATGNNGGNGAHGACILYWY